MDCGCAFRPVRYEVHEHESDAVPRLSSVAGTLNYPEPIFSRPGIIRGLRSPLSVAVSPNTHPFLFLFCLPSASCTCIIPLTRSHLIVISHFHSVPLNCILIESHLSQVVPPCPSSPQRHWASRPDSEAASFPGYRLVLSQAPDVTGN